MSNPTSSAASHECSSSANDHPHGPGFTPMRILEPYPRRLRLVGVTQVRDCAGEAPFLEVRSLGLRESEASSFEFACGVNPPALLRSAPLADRLQHRKMSELKPSNKVSQSDFVGR